MAEKKKEAPEKPQRAKFSNDGACYVDGATVEWKKGDFVPLNDPLLKKYMEDAGAEWEEV